MRQPIIPHTQIWPITAQLFACKSSKVTNYFLWLWKACGGETCCRLSWLLPYLVRNVQFTSVWKSTEEREDAGRPTVDMAHISHLQIVIFLKGGTPVCFQIRERCWLLTQSRLEEKEILSRTNKVQTSRDSEDGPIRCRTTNISFILELSSLKWKC